MWTHTGVVYNHARLECVVGQGAQAPVVVGALRACRYVVRWLGVWFLNHIVASVILQY